MKINELLKPNEGFNLNEAQVAANRCCCHIHTGGGEFEKFWAISTLRSAPSPSTPPSLVFTHAFPGVEVTRLGLWERAVFQCFHWLGSTWEKKSGILCGPTPSGGPCTPPPLPHPSTTATSTPPKSLVAHVKRSAPDMRGNNDVRKMGLDLCCLVSWEEV